MCCLTNRILSLFLEDKLTDDETQVVMEHLNVCTQCRKNRNLIGWFMLFSSD